MKISQIMTPNPVCCWPSSSTLAAALLMQESEAGILPVIQDPFTPRLVGVVTDRDLCLHVVASGRDPASTWVDGCMTPDPVWCTELDEVSHALELMGTHRLRRIPVVNDKHEVVGIVSLSDVVRHSAASDRDIATVLQSIYRVIDEAAPASERLITAA